MPVYPRALCPVLAPGSVLIWALAALAILIGVCGVVARASNEGIRVTSIGHVAEPSPPVHTELITEPDAADYVDDWSACRKCRAGATRYSWNEEFPRSE